MSESVVRIGYSLDLEGPYSANDVVVRDVHAAYFAEVNKAGGIDGREVELMVLDNGFDVPLHLDNLAQLVEASDRGVVAIGDLSHPLFGDASVSVLSGSDLLVVTDLEPAEPATGGTEVVSVAGSMCQQTAGALAALAPTDGARRRLALIGRQEAWAAESMETAREVADGLGFDIVTDIGDFTEPEDAVPQLLEVQSDVVWLAVAPRDLAALASVIEPAGQSWLWAGTSLTYDSAVLEGAAASALSRVYLHVSAVELAENAPDQVEVLSGLLPELTNGEAASALAAWKQAEFLHKSIEDAIAERDATRSGLVDAAQDLEAPAAEVSLYRLQPGSARTAGALSGEVGTQGLALADDLTVPAASSSVCR